MANVLSDEKRQQIEALGRLGWSLRRIHREAGVHRETVSLYLRSAGIPIRGRGGAKPKPATLSEVITDLEAKPASLTEVITDSARTASACEPYRELIERWLDDGREGMSIWQELVERYGFRARYSSVQRFVRGLRKAQPPEARVVIQTRPGEESQVDYSDGPMVRHPELGKYRRARLFLLTLAHSRKAVRLLSWKSSSRIWAQLHEQAFRRLGGTTATVVLDNLLEGVLKPDIYEPLLNPLYRDVLAHYGVVALPCRVRDPDRKGKVESGIQHTQRALRGLRFESLEEGQAWLDRWDERWADTRIHGTTKRQVAAMFAEEKPHLRPLPIEPFRYYEFGERTVHLDGFVEVQAAYYAPPPGWIGRTLRVQWDDLHVRLLDPKTGALLREHLVAQRGHHRMRQEDQPTQTPPGVTALLARAHGIGPSAGAIADTIYAAEPLRGVRRVLGLCHLAKRHGAATVERAAKVALDAGALTYRAVKACLAHQQETPVGLRQVDPLIRELTVYRDLVLRMTQGEPT